MKKIGFALSIILALVLATATLPGCATHDGLIPAMADGSLAGCVEWAQANHDAELEALCRAGRPLTEVLDLFAARQRQALSRDAGAEGSATTTHATPRCGALHATSHDCTAPSGSSTGCPTEPSWRSEASGRRARA